MKRALTYFDYLLGITIAQEARQWKLPEGISDKLVIDLVDKVSSSACGTGLQLSQAWVESIEENYWFLAKSCLKELHIHVQNLFRYCVTHSLLLDSEIPPTLLRWI